MSPYSILYSGSGFGVYRDMPCLRVFSKERESAIGYYFKPEFQCKLKLVEKDSTIRSSISLKILGNLANSKQSIL